MAKEGSESHDLNTSESTEIADDTVLLSIRSLKSWKIPDDCIVSRKLLTALSFLVRIFEKYHCDLNQYILMTLCIANLFCICFYSLAVAEVLQNLKS